MKAVLCTLNAKYIHSSLALPYLKLFCENPSRQIEILEFTINQPLDDIRTRLFLSRPDVLCFSCYIWNIEPILTLCRDLKLLMPECVVILGGPEVSFDAAELLGQNNSVQIIVRGEGEHTLQEVLNSMQKGDALDGIKGITYRSENGIIDNEDRALIHNLDDIPSPYQGDLSEYQDRLVYYESSRGCPFNCSYCLSSTFQGVRTFALERVRSDLAILMDYGVSTVKFVDRTFNSNEKRAREIMEFIIAHNSSTRFHFEVCADLISDDFMNFLLQVPDDVFAFEIGIQSTFLPALNAVNRSCDMKRFEDNVIKLAAQGNIHLHLDLIAGLPLETYTDFRKSFNDVYRLRPDVIQLGFLKMLKGSSLRRTAKEYGYVYQDHSPYQVLSSTYMKYHDFIVLSNIERLVDRYYNSGEFNNGLKYINTYIYNDDTFTFLEGLAAFFQEKGWFLQGHSRSNEYNMLMSFVEDRFPEQQSIVNEYLKYDYIMNNRHKPLPERLMGNDPDNCQLKLYKLLKDQDFISKELSELAHLSKYELGKRVQLAAFAFDPTQINRQAKENMEILFVYSPNQRKAARTIFV